MMLFTPAKKKREFSGRGASMQCKIALFHALFFFILFCPCIGSGLQNEKKVGGWDGAVLRSARIRKKENLRKYKLNATKCLDFFHWCARGCGVAFPRSISFLFLPLVLVILQWWQQPVFSPT
ncbi:hypothetical protein V8C40DRAFT_242132 [Trichoderma camerunense]